MREMDFINGIQKPWTNVTVRLGYKWANLKIGEEIMLLDKKEPMGLAGRVIQILVKSFNKIKHDELRHHHDPLCRTRKGLSRAIKFYHPDFKLDDPVTLITYVVRKVPLPK